MSTPQSASKKKKKKTTFRLSSSAAGSATQDDAIFTDDMRDRQARGKDPYAYGSEDDDDDEGDMMRFGDARSDRERFRAVEQRRIAAQILGDPELLMMYAMSRQDSIPGTRLHFMRVLCGQPDKDEPPSRRAFDAHRGSPGNAQRRSKGS